MATNTTAELGSKENPYSEKDYAQMKKDGTIVAVEETPNNSRHINSPMIRTINGDGKIFLMLLESR